MRVLHVHSGNLYGGVETLMVTLARHRDLCPEMETDFALCFEGRLSEELIATGVTVYSLGNARISRPISVWRSRRALSDLFGRERFDVIVCHSSWTQAIFGPVARAARMPLVFWLHGAAYGRHWLEQWARKTEPDFALCNSQFTASTLPNLYPKIRAEVFYCPVTFPDMSYSKSELSATRAELSTLNDEVVIIQISRMEDGKGHRLHLEALAMLKDTPGWVCWMVGGAQRSSEIQYLNGVKADAKRLAIFDRIRFAGQRDDVSKLLAAADIHCQPNTGPEGFGITFIEGLYARRPVVTTDLGGPKEILDDSCGMLVPPGDRNALAAALRRLIEDSALRAQMGEAGPIRAKQLCDPSARIRQLYQILSGTPENGYREKLNQGLHPA